MKPIRLLSSCILGACLLLAAKPGQLRAQNASSYIVVDQFGYLTDQPKVAVLRNPVEGYDAGESYTAPNTLEIINAATGTSVWSGSPLPWNGGATQTTSGDQGWWFDFSMLDEPGEYYLLDEISGEQSAIFTISENPFAEVLKQTARMFYYNRCGSAKEVPYADPPWTDGDNFAQDNNARYIYAQDDSSLERDVSGGWFDAGDYNKYTTFTYTTLNDLLSAYENKPDAFSDDWGIPESGNTLPDILDEVIWELEWLKKMYNPDGSVHQKAGSRNYSENVASPPSANSDTRYYGPTCTSASVVVANVMAHASVVLRQFEGWEGYANDLAQKAMQCFDYARPFFESGAWETDCDDGSIVAGDADMDAWRQINVLLEAAVYLYELTGDTEYGNFVGEYYLSHSIFQNNYFDHYNINSLDALLRYTTLWGAEPAMVADLTSIINEWSTNNYESLLGFNELDLYRAFQPPYSFHWGSNDARAKLGNFNLLFAQYNILSDADNYEYKAMEQLHYFHGVNPLGMVQLSNMYDYGAERSVNEIYHTWFYDGTDFDHALNSAFGPAPGYLTGGPNVYYSYSELSPPHGQPEQKSYLDFNTGWPESSWEITEPAIYYQAAYLRLLSHFVSSSPVSSTVVKEQQHPGLTVYPNPSSGEVWIVEAPTGYTHFDLRNVAGQLVQTGLVGQYSIELPHEGLFLLSVYDPTKPGETLTQKVVAQ